MDFGAGSHGYFGLFYDGCQSLCVDLVGLRCLGAVAFVEIFLGGTLFKRRAMRKTKDSHAVCQKAENENDK